MPSRKELVAHGRDNDEIASAIGADVVIFQTLEDLVESVRRFQPSIENFDCSVFTGEYVTGGVEEDYLQHLETLRADNNRAKILNQDPVALEVNGQHDGKAVNGIVKDQEKKTGSNSFNGSDDTVGLHNSWNTHS